MDKLIIVYGTQNPDKRGSEYDRETAYLVKNNLMERFRLYGRSPSIIIKADKNLTDEDLRHNLILIGGPVANGVVKQLNDELPVKFIFNGSWILRRNPSNVKEFAAFYVTPDYVEQKQKVQQMIYQSVPLVAIWNCRISLLIMQMSYSVEEARATIEVDWMPTGGL